MESADDQPWIVCPTCLSLVHRLDKDKDYQVGSVARANLKSTWFHNQKNDLYKGDEKTLKTKLLNAKTKTKT